MDLQANNHELHQLFQVMEPGASPFHFPTWAARMTRTARESHGWKWDAFTKAEKHRRLVRYLREQIRTHGRAVDAA